jgi:thioester reductase-like protein
MAWFALIVQLLPAILKLMGLAEQAFSGESASGAKKKELVMGAAEAIVGGIQSISTGGQAETWDRIAAPVSIIIDAAASIAFPHDSTEAMRNMGAP